MVKTAEPLFAGTWRALQPKPRPFAAWVIDAPGKAFAAFLALHAAAWTLLPTLLYANLPLDLIEALMYGREWQLGYDKLPPLPWWLVEFMYRLVGHDFVYYLLAQVAVVAAFVLIYATAFPLIGGLGALVSVLILDGLHYLNYTSSKFNHDVIQLPFWALAGYALHRGLRRGRMLDWILLGIGIGLSLWAKYFVAVLVAPMVVFALVDRDARKALATPGPYVAAIVALVVTSPHLVWLVQNNFLPFGYAERRAVLPRGWYDHLWHPFEFAVSQLFFLIPSLLIAAPLFWPRHIDSPARPREGGDPALTYQEERSRWIPAFTGISGVRGDAFDYRIVSWLAFGPFATVLLLGLVSGRGAVAMWGYPLWLFLGLWIVMTAHRALARLLPRILATWGIVFSALALAFIVDYAVLPHIDHRYRAAFFPGASLGAQIEERFKAATGRPPDYVIGSMWDGGNVEHYAPSHPRVLVDGRPERAPWIDLADLKAKGAVVVWTDGDLNQVPEEYRAVAPNAQVQAPLRLHYRDSTTLLEVGWAIVPPAR
jgi:4-amino-4-deoxy-L-arabinose transferase-like glycosyltransferase